VAALRKNWKAKNHASIHFKTSAKVTRVSLSLAMEQSIALHLYQRPVSIIASFLLAHSSYVIIKLPNARKTSASTP
jgi:hypothetical protein